MQVRFHPLDSDIFASGSLDHKVVVWRISSGEKIFNHDFGKNQSSANFGNIEEHLLSNVDSALLFCTLYCRQTNSFHSLPSFWESFNSGIGSQGMYCRSL
jgi:WD40 repeat protein